LSLENRGTLIFGILLDALMKAAVQFEFNQKRNPILWIQNSSKSSLSFLVFTADLMQYPMSSLNQAAIHGVSIPQ
jgi:hypothetical protein